jgi:phosphoglycolate phosphatase
LLICNPFLNGISLDNLKGIIFDCDGVLFDSRDVNIKFYNEIRNFFDLPAMTWQEEEFVHSHSVRDSFNHILPEGYQAKLPAIRDRLDYSKLLPYMRMEDGLMELMEFLAGKTVKTAINTNRTTTMNLLLSTFGLEKYFWPVVTAADVSRPKPHPESLFKILDHWSVMPHEVVFIGDSIVDQETALGAQTPFWAFKNEGLQAQMLIPDFWTLREFLMRNLN